MNRTLDQTAALLGLKPRAFRIRLRELGVLNSSGDLASAHRDRGYLFSDPRSRWNPAIGKPVHYAVVMVKEAGIEWLAKKLDITITRKDKTA
ncbi:hypothetical protein [Pseudomonas mediterranea]|uniref:hypothetical protein n=1 Tax=Pseudomonas mediterranea TaxID=183795 RepID=UPI001D9435AA|nr:hypothetical protein [Pseudomonas mediterranea]CAH0154224.1 hypothetical protein SRABI112_00766 [Pseudomonas mediterranea]